METIYFTITGLNYRYGSDFLEPGMKVNLEKETDNQFDKEAIMVTLPGLGKIGYVATNYKTMIGESYSSGRLYDKIGNVSYGEVCYILDRGVLCKLIRNQEENYKRGRKKR